MKLINGILLYNRKNKHFIVIFIIFILSSLPFQSNSQPFTFKNIRISEALTEVAKTMEIRINFDADELQKLSISKTIRGKNIDTILKLLLENTGYTYLYKHKTYLIIRENKIKDQASDKKVISGFVYDKETGERLPYATILFKDANISLPATVDGTFSAILYDSVSTAIQIRYLGYYTYDTIISSSFNENFLKIGLNKKIHSLESVDITENKIDIVEISNEAGHLTFNPARFADLPNYGETDVFRALQMLPGIGWKENSAQLNIRGSSADQNLVIFDGFTLYNLDHFFGVFSALNPNVVKNIQVFRGGFDSSYGERLSGIVDITGKSGNQQKPQFYGGINLISANLTTEIPVSKKLTLVAAGRRAFSDIYSSWLADEILSRKIGQTRRFPGQANTIEPEFYFSDYNLKLTYSVNAKENFAISAYGATDNLNSSNFSSNNQFSIDTEDNNKWGNFGLGFSWKKQWSPKYYTTLQLGHSGYFNDYYSETLVENTNNSAQTNMPLPNEDIINESNDLTDYFLSFNCKYFINHNNQFDFGIATRYNSFAFYKDASTDIIYNNLKSSAFLYSGFLQDKINLTEKLTIKPGLRINIYGQTGKFYMEPRFSASYQTKNNLTFKIATGRYLQFLNKSSSEQTYGYNRDFWVLADGVTHPVVSSNHYIAGISINRDKLFFDAEIYYKTINGLQEYLFFQDPDQHMNEPINTPGLSRFISGKGRAYGIDLLAKYENNGLTSWLSYSLSKATRTYEEINNGESIPALYDQTHEIKWTNIYSFRKWNFSTLALYTTGRPYITNSEKDNQFNTIRNYSRLPDYFRIDLSMNYNISFKKVNIKPGISILNALNTENYLDIYVRNLSLDNNRFTETTLIKAQKLTLNFYINFRF